ncbi:MAG: PD40 domain-containing protein [Chloroflexi bacterium]|nr:PD40 domain-containing protein [Chloroflexota bacterium]
MKPSRVFPLILALLLGACAAPASIGPIATQSSISTEVGIVDSPGSPPTTVSTAVDESIQTILVSLTADQKRLIAKPIDPGTLQDLPNFKPIDLRHHYTDAVSSTGQLWAVVMWPADTDYEGVLHLINLNNWTDRPTPLKFDNAVQMLFSPDGLRLAVAETWDKVSGGVDHWGADIKIIAPNELANFKTIELSYRPRRMQFSADSHQLIVYGTPWPTLWYPGEVPFWLAGGAPQVTAFDALTGKRLWAIGLDAVKDGEYREPTTDDPNLVNLYTPGVAFSRDGQWLYVVHPDEDQLTTVDLTSGSAKAVAITEPQSWLDRLLALTAGTAYAKGGALGGADKTAVLAPDEARLYITGGRSEVQKDAGSPTGFKEIDTPLDIQVIVPQSGERLTSEENALTGKTGEDVMWSPDGRWLYLLARQPVEGRPGLEVYDPALGQFAAQLAEGAAYVELKFSASNDRAYFTYSVNNPVTPTVELNLLDLNSNQIIGTREVAGWVGDLVLLPR